MNSELTNHENLPGDISNATSIVQKETKNALIIIALFFLISFCIFGLVLMSTTSLEKLSIEEDSLINVWQEINNQVIHISGYQQLSKLHALKIHARTQELIDHEALVQKKIDQLLSKNSWFSKLLLNPEQIQTLYSTPANNNKILDLINIFQTAPLSLLQTGYSDWDLSLIVSVRSGKTLAPLKERARIVDLLQRKMVDVSWSLLIIIININLLSLLWVWARMLKPTFVQLEKSMSRERAQLKKTIIVEKSKIEQNKEMAILLNNLPALVASIDSKFQFVATNRLYKEYFGFGSDDNLSSVPVKEIVGDKNWQEIKPQLQKAFNGEKVEYDIETELPAGSRILRATYAPGLRKNKKVNNVFALIVDIHKRRLLEDALRESEKNIRITLESIGEAVIATDQHGHVTRMNPVAENLTKWNFDSASGRSITTVLNLIDKKDQQKCVDLVSEISSLKKSKTFSRNIILIAKDGHEKDISFTKSPIFNANKKTIGSVILFRDITKEVALNDQLIASEKMRSVGLLASGISHDFNNILAGIQGAAEYLLLLSKDKLSQDDCAMLESILDAVKRGAGLSKKLVEFSKKEKKQDDPVDISIIMEQALDIFNRTSGKAITVEMNNTATETIILGDESGLHSTFLNLLINSKHAMRDGGNILIEMKNVELNSTDCEHSGFELSPGQYLQISVADTGCGIEKRVIKTIFEPFFTTKDTGDGYGLGLYIVYSNIVNHGGSIEVNSSIGKGTEFVIHLPSSQ